MTTRSTQIASEPFSTAGSTVKFFTAPVGYVTVIKGIQAYGASNWLISLSKDAGAHHQVLVLSPAGGYLNFEGWVCLDAGDELYYFLASGPGAFQGFTVSGARLPVP